MGRNSGVVPQGTAESSSEEGEEWEGDGEEGGGDEEVSGVAEGEDMREEEEQKLIAPAGFEMVEGTPPELDGT